MFKTFEELHKYYGTYEGGIARDELDYETEKKFVNDCFDTYEHIGFTETFDSPYTDYKYLKGMRFTVIGRLNENNADLEVLPMWKIRFENGEEIDAYPEEICLAERNNKTW